VLVLAACGGTSQATIAAPINDPTGLLNQYSWSPSTGAEVSTVVVPQQGQFGVDFTLYLDASKAVGLDFSPLAGKELSLQTFPLNQQTSDNQPIRAHILMDGENVVGAWLSADNAVPGIYPLNAKL
jgi:hypothetical protein